MDEGTPRRTAESTSLGELAAVVKKLRDQVQGLQRGSSLRNASISGGDGLRVVDEAGNLRITLNTADGAVVAYDATETPVARFGPTDFSDPGSYGVEVFVEGAWLKLGTQVAAWNNIGGKPAEYDAVTNLWDPAPHTHPGGEVTSTVASATHAGQSDGSEYGWTNNVAGTTFYALWVGNDGGFHFGRNTSSIKYKQNVRSAASGDPKRVLKLRPVVYDRKPTLEVLPEGQEGPRREFPGATNEYGLIAEETLPHVPEVVTYFENKIDGLRYDLLPVAMIPLLQEHDQELADLRQENSELRARLDKLDGGTA